MPSCIPSLIRFLTSDGKNIQHEALSIRPTRISALEEVLRLTRVEANVDLKDRRRRFLKGIFKKTRMSGASAMTPGNNRLHREFKVKGTEEHLLRSNATT